MNKVLIVLISAVILFGFLAPASAVNPFISFDQSINFTADGVFFWAMIWDYTHASRESATPGPINYDYTLGYTLGLLYGDRNVAYLYDWAASRYIEAQALRNVEL